MERFKVIEDYPNFMISSFGRVYNRKTKKFRAITIDTYGYCTIKLHHGSKSYNFKIHRLVAKHFIPNPRNLRCVCHKDDDKTNNNINNLWWGSHMDNMRDMYAKGRENHAKVKVFCIDTGEIFESMSDAARYCNTDPSTLRQAIKKSYKCANQRWSYL